MSIGLAIVVFTIGCASSDALYRAPDGAKWGYIHSDGTWAIKPIYDDAAQFSEGLAVVEIGGKWGYINQRGQMVIQPQYTDAYSFRDGLARVATKEGASDTNLSGGTGYGWIDKTGKFVISRTWDQADSFYEGLAVVVKGSSFGYINEKGTIVIPLKFQNAGSFSEGLAYAMSGGKWGYIDKKGSWVISPMYGLNPGILVETWRSSFYLLGVSQFHNGYAVVWDSEKNALNSGVCHFIDKTGKTVFGRTFESAGEFHEGLAEVMVNDLWGFIDTKGRMIIQPQFYGGMDLTWKYPGFSDDLAAVTNEQGGVGYIDRTGKWVIKPTFMSGSSFVNGIAYVSTTVVSPDLAPYLVIDRTGHVVFKNPASLDTTSTSAD